MIDRLVCEDVDLDLTEGIPIPVTYSIADIKDPSKRKRNVSKEVTIQGTSNNNAYFSGSFSLSVSGVNVSFDATKKATFILYKRGVKTLDGVMQLLDVTLNDGQIKYKIRLFSESVDLFLLLQNVKANELNWSEYNHILSRENIKASWTTPSGSGYRYPLIVRRQLAGSTIFNTTDLVPYVHLRELLIKLCEYTGFNVSGDFLDDPNFKNVLFGYGGGEFSAINTQQSNIRRIKLIDGGFSKVMDQNFFPLEGTTTTQTLTYEVASAFGANFTNTVDSDVLNQFNDGVITVAFSGNYIFSVNFNYNYSINNADKFYRYQPGGIVVFVNGEEFHTIRYAPLSAGPTYLYTPTGTVNFTIGANLPLSLNSGDVITFSFGPGLVEYRSLTPFPFITNSKITITPNDPITVQLEAQNVALVDNDSVVSLNNYIPDTKGSEVFAGVIKHFNLYNSDPESQDIELSPFVDYYKPTNQFDDWSELVDLSKPIVLKPTANEYGKNVLFNFKEVKDHHQQDYISRYGVGYGNHNQSQGSYYAKGEIKIDLPWGTIAPYDLTSDILVPLLGTLDDNGLVKPEKGAPRVMMWNGLKPGAWTFRNTDNPLLSEQLTTYPSVHHFNDWQNPTFDLNFQLVNRVYYNNALSTTNNCYNLYYADFINEMISALGKIYVGYFKIIEDQIKKLDFSKLKMINGTLWRLNEISDFDPSIDGNETVKIELVKVLQARSKKRFVLGQQTVPTEPIIQPPRDPDGDTGVISTPTGVGINSGIIRNR